MFFLNRPKEFIECVSHIRLLSWLLLGSLTHNVVCPNSPSAYMPIPLDAGSHVADHLIVILIGFPEQSKVRGLQDDDHFMIYHYTKGVYSLEYGLKFFEKLSSKCNLYCGR